MNIYACALRLREWAERVMENDSLETPLSPAECEEMAAYLDRLHSPLYLYGIEENDCCPKCSGRGRRAYGSTATWRGGVGGQMITDAVCDECWGTGEKSRKGANLREMENYIASLERRLSES